MLRLFFVQYSILFIPFCDYNLLYYKQKINEKMFVSNLLKHHSDTEWKFARSKLLMEYINDGFTLPAPLNLIPTPLSMYYAIKGYCQKYEKSKNANANSECNIVDEPSVNINSQTQQANFAHNNSKYENNSKVKKKAHSNLLP